MEIKMTQLFRYAGDDRPVRKVRTHNPPTLVVVENLPPPPPRPPMVLRSDNTPAMQPILKKILFEVCRKHGVHPDDLAGPSKDFHFCHARRDYFYRAMTETNASATRVGQTLRKDHTTVLHAVRVVKDGTRSREPFVAKPKR